MYDFSNPFLGNEAEINAARQILYLCVDNSLRILAPSMPFVTEELWQRLPKRSTETAPSLCVAYFPIDSDFIGFRNEELDAKYSSNVKKDDQLEAEESKSKETEV
jgi:valyl-tRNA synthetase